MYKNRSEGYNPPVESDAQPSSQLPTSYTLELYDDDEEEEEEENDEADHEEPCVTPAVTQRYPSRLCLSLK